MNGQCEDNNGCGPGQTPCFGVCRNLANDNEHCGSCSQRASDFMLKLTLVWRWSQLRGGDVPLAASTYVAEVHASYW